ncbi:MAG: hypothetical protein AAFN92_00885 [Bacteroidota bacterium]
MLRCLFTFIPFLFICALLPAQAETTVPYVEFGPNLGQKRFSHLNKFLTSDGSGGVYALQAVAKKGGLAYDFAIGHYDREMRLKESVPVARDDKSFEDAFALGDQLVVLSSSTDKRAKKHNLYATVYHRESLKPSGQPQLVLSAPQPTGLMNKMYKTSAPKRFTIKLTPDSSQLVIVHNGALPVGGMKVFPPKKNPGSVTVAVLNSELETVWQQHYELPVTDYAFALSDIATDNSGAVSLLYSYKARGSRHRQQGDGMRNAYFQLWHLSGKDGALSSLDLDAEGHSLGSLSLAAAPSGNRIAVAGYFGEKASPSAAMGTASFLVNPLDMGGTTTRFQDFSTEILHPSKKEKAKSIPSLFVFRSKLSDEGELLLLGEQRSLEPSRNGSSFAAITYDDIVFSQLSGDVGEQVNVRVRKQQKTQADAVFASAAVLFSKMGTILLFNDHKANVNRAPDEKIMPFHYYHSDMVTVMVTIGEDGSQEKELLFTGEETDAFLRPDLVNLQPNGEILAFAHWKKMHLLLRITVPELTASSR